MPTPFDRLPGDAEHSSPDSSKRTPGSLILGYGSVYRTLESDTPAGRWDVVADCRTEGRHMDGSRADAAHIVTCWNACEGHDPADVALGLEALRRLRALRGAERGVIQTQIGTRNHHGREVPDFDFVDCREDVQGLCALCSHSSFEQFDDPPRANEPHADACPFGVDDS